MRLNDELVTEPLTIGEFARRSGLTISALRFYDECGLLLPHRVDDVTGYRSYLAEQLPMAQLVRGLRALGMPIAEVRRALGSSPEEQRAAVASRLKAETSRLEELRSTAEEVNRQITERENQMKMVVRSDVLKRAIKAAAPMVSSDPERALLGGILVEARNGSLRAVATDGYRLSVREVPAMSGHAAAFRGAVSTPELLDWAATLEEGCEVGLEIVGDQLVADGQSARTFSLIDGTYPDYEVILSVREEWFPAIMRADEFQDAVEESPEDPVHLLFSSSGVTVEGRNAAVDARYEGPDLEIAFDRGFLRDVLSVTMGPDIAIEVTDSASAAYFRSAEDATSVALLMPVRIR